MIFLPDPPVYEKEPWNISFHDRMLQMRRAINEGKKISIMLYHEADTSTFRYRCYNIMQATLTSSRWFATYVFKSEMNQISQLLEEISLLILVRSQWSLDIELLVKRAKQKGIPVLFDVDDKVFDTSSIKLLSNSIAVSLNQEDLLNYWFSYIGRIQEAAALADGFITTNDYLGRELNNKYNKDYCVIVNSLNQEQLQVSKIMRDQKEYGEGNKFTIGYFSGTPSHRNDFKECWPEILHLLEFYADIELVIVGFLESVPEGDLLFRQGRIRLFPLVDFLALQRLIAQVDVNIVPLLDNDFTNCKSELKYFEAAAVNTITAASPTYTYRHAIKNGENGFLCRPGQWYETLENIYLKKVDKVKICKAALDHTLQNYSGHMVLKQVENAYDFFQNKS